MVFPVRGLGMKPHIHALKQYKTYNTLVSDESIEDYALRYVASSSRRWGPGLLAGTALGGISFLALEAIGASLILNFGFTNTLLAVLTFLVISLIMGAPIAYYSSRANVDIDLLTRGAGFGYLGSTITSLIYASYTIIFFAMEGAIMAKALNLSLGLPMQIAYLISSLAIIPIAFYGITMINKLQKYTQPIWIGLSGLAVAGILWAHPEGVRDWTHFARIGYNFDTFDILLFGTALSTTFSLLPQIGEQVDYLRFMPNKTPENSRAWWWAVLGAGPGWSVVGAMKLLIGSYLAARCVSTGIISLTDSSDPVTMYLVAFESVLKTPWIAVMVTTLFVVTCQIKINVTNAYAGSLAWSNFFLRVMHSHPGRAVWLIFNVIFAYLLMQFGVLRIIESLLVGYASFATAWIGALFTDLAILKHIGLSPPHIEFRRAFLYDINPVGFGGMIMGLAVAIIGQYGFWGPMPKAYAPLIALVVSILSSLLIAIFTGGRYYLARSDTHTLPKNQEHKCDICLGTYEGTDMLFCPAYNEYICSLCCSLDTVCNRMCNSTRFYLPFIKHLSQRCITFLSYFATTVLVIVVLFIMCYSYLQLDGGQVSATTKNGLIVLLIAIVLSAGIGAWWAALIQQNRTAAEEELSRYIRQLEQEVTHRKAIAADLATLSEQQRLILENASIGIAFAIDTCLVWSNQRFWAVFEVPESERLTGYNFWNMLHCADIDLEALKNDLYNPATRQSTCVKEMLLRLPSGERWCILTINIVNYPSLDAGCILLANDITNRKNAEEQLRQSKESLRQLNENLEQEVIKRTEELKRYYQDMHRTDKMASLGILISGMAHEVNNPVSFIRLNSGIVQRCVLDMLLLVDEKFTDTQGIRIGGMDYTYAHRSIPKLLSGIQDGAERITSIVSNLKDYSRQMPVNLSGHVHLNTALDAALALLAAFIRQSTDYLSVSKANHLPHFAGDQRRVEQVIINLVQNACQALNNRTQQIRIATTLHDGHVELSVRDYGKGISDDDLKHVLDPFFTTKREMGGTGLGLAVSQGIMNEHGGTLHIDSALGEGTTVTLSFPLQTS